MIDKSELFDVVVLGAGPAGATAANLLAARKRRVVLLDAACYPRSTVCTGWLSAHVQPLLTELDVSMDAVGSDELTNVVFHTADFTKTTHPVFEHAPGYVIDRASFDNELVAAARRAGAEFLPEHRVTGIRLDEGSVKLSIEGGGVVNGSLLVMAAGRNSPLMGRMGLAGVSQGGGWIAQIQAEGIAADPEPTVHVILGVDRSGGFGTYSSAGGRVSISVHGSTERSEVVAHLVTLCRSLAGAGIVTADLQREAAGVIALPNPAAAALSMDTHVAKRALIVGDAGGFVSASSGEGIYPGMWSARIGVDVIDEALNALSPQDVLMTFDTRWRSSLADYLRAPNTDAHYLLPLIFSNQPMADRMGAAFFCGENI